MKKITLLARRERDAGVERKAAEEKLDVQKSGGHKKA